MVRDQFILIIYLDRGASLAALLSAAVDCCISLTIGRSTLFVWCAGSAEDNGFYCCQICVHVNAV